MSVPIEKPQRAGVTMACEEALSAQGATLGGLAFSRRAFVAGLLVSAAALKIVASSEADAASPSKEDFSKALASSVRSNSANCLIFGDTDHTKLDIPLSFDEERLAVLKRQGVSHFVLELSVDQQTTLDALEQAIFKHRVFNTVETASRLGEARHAVIKANEDVGWFNKKEDRVAWAKNYLNFVERIINADIHPVCAGPRAKDAPSMSDSARRLLLDLIDANQQARGDEKEYDRRSKETIGRYGDDVQNELAAALSAMKATKAATNERVVGAVRRHSAKGNVAVLIGADHVPNIVETLRVPPGQTVTAFRLDVGAHDRGLTEDSGSAAFKYRITIEER